MPERTTIFAWSAVQQVRELCVYFLSLPVFSFAPDLLHSQIMRLDMTYRPIDRSINQSVNQSKERLGNIGFTSISLSSNAKNPS